MSGVQSQAAGARGRDVILLAGAGAGKTRALVERYLGLLDGGLTPRSVAAVTFTDKAAREMRSRIRQAARARRLADASPAEAARWAAVEAEMDSARIGTIHHLCAGLLKAHAAEAGVDPRFEVLEEGQAAALRAEAVEWALGQGALDASLAAVYTLLGGDDLRAGLSHLLEESAEWDPAQVEALWTEQLRAHLAPFVESQTLADAIQVLKACCKSQAALEADAGPNLTLELARALLDACRTLRAAWESGDVFLAAARAQAVERARAGVGRKGRAGQVKNAVSALRDLYAGTLDAWLPDEAADIDQEIIRALGPLKRLLDLARAKYAELKDQRQALDFDDLEAGARRLLRDCAEVRARWLDEIQAVLVDEFQDTNARQREIVECLAGWRDGAPAGRLFVVGDAKQSIYRFRGADVAVFRSLDRDLQARGGLRLEMDETYRAHPALVSALNGLLRPVLDQAAASGRDYTAPFTALECARQEPARPGLRPPVEFVVGCGARAADARPVAAALLAARLIELRRSGGLESWGDVALLFRASTTFHYYETAFEDAGIPFVTVAGRGFYDRPEIRDALNLLRAAADPEDDLAMFGLLRSPAFGLSDAALYRLRWQSPGRRGGLWSALHESLDKLPEEDRAPAARARACLEEFAPLAGRLPVAELLERILEAVRYLAGPGGQPGAGRIRRNLDKLMADARAGGGASVPAFLEYLQAMEEAGAREGEAPVDAGDAARLMTIHKAKGLQFPVVVLADAAHAGARGVGAFIARPEFGLALEPGKFGRASAVHALAAQIEKEQSAAEDARLLYVALTRAQEKFILSGHWTGRGAAGWLKALLEQLGSDVSDLLDKAPSEFELPEAGPARIWAASRAPEAAAAASAPRPPEAGGEKPLHTPLPAWDVAWGAPQEPDDEPRDWDAIEPGTPRGAWAGTLVHAALARWLFPGDAGLEPLLKAEAQALGVPDVTSMIQRVTALLARLRADPRWDEMDRAHRDGRARHEVEYARLVDGRPERGRLDLIYPGADGWVVVDFKSDHLAAEADLQARAEKYRRQIERYRAAGEQLLGGRVRAELCFLDCGGGLRWEG